MSLKGLEDQLKSDANKALENAKGIEKASEREAHETYLASEILLKLIENKRSVARANGVSQRAVD